MDKFRNLVEDTFNSGDPEIRTWFLIRNSYLPFFLCGMYVFFSTYLGPAIMRNRKPFHLRMPMIIFNFSLVFVYTTCLLIILWNCQYLTLEHFCKEQKLRKGHAMYLVGRIIWVTYILKYVEFLDTVFFVFRKKGNLINLLHVAHHTATPIVYWILFRTERSFTAAVPASLVMLEHIVMYSYFGLAAMGPSVRKYLWWKKYVTQLQMIQFLLIFVLVTVVAPVMGCKMGFFNYVLHITCSLFFLYLFYRFYVTQFQSRKEEDKRRDEIGFKKE